MGKTQLLDAIELGLLREMARSVSHGTANHQELAIARGLLRDNKRIIPQDEPEDDDTLPPQDLTKLPAREFGPYAHDE